MADIFDRKWWDRLDDTYSEQVTLLVDAGVDVSALEMMEYPELCGPAVNATLESGLPVWLGFSAHQTENGLMSRYKPDPIRFEDNVKALITDKVDAVFVMHTSVSDVIQSLKVVADHWDGPIGVYPESGYFVEPHWQFVDIIQPRDLVSSAREWVDSGVQIVGGCCGLGVRHIEALSSELS
jgi:S-methylmethionine-dependent homocysteine/selenocysteine methylase